MNQSSSLQVQHRSSSQEIATSASAALAKATIEAKFVIALQRPRSVLAARASILDACRRQAFAEGAMYRKKQGRKEVNGRWEDNYVEGLSIRFAEQALNAWKNVDVTSTTVWEDENNRLVRITVTDLETNLSYSDEAMMAKTVERKKVKEGQEVIGERETSEGGKVYIVRCTDEELQNKVNSAKSKSIRNSGLRLIPQDILEEAEAAIRETAEKGGTDPKGQTKRIVDAFHAIGVSAIELQAYIGHSLEQLQPKELGELRSIHSAIKDGEARWADYVTTADDDQIPGAEAPAKSASEAKPETKSAEKPEKSAEKPAGPEASPNQRLSDVLASEGITFDELVAWGERTGNVSDARSLDSYDAIPAATATRLLRAVKGLVNQIKASRKGGAS